MVTRSKYYIKLKPLIKRPAFTIGEAIALGIPRHALAYFERKGVLERVAKGVYRDPHYEEEVDITLEGLALAAFTTKNAVICLISALNYYDMTDEIPREHWLAIPHLQRAPSRDLVRIVRMRNTELGRKELRIGKYKLAIFDRERCIIDAFRYLSSEIAIKSLQAYLRCKENKPNLTKLQGYAKQLRVNLKPYIMALTT